ncbi:carbonic anhydrase [Saccharopolyspora antimicrobica]|uniref:Carbonic anhydrase n=1 Tax=Saccharopolyspora antimicrobica TaxID=455193 RepID=A0A1I4TZM4_9PSEU|nr:carbonic anhydrase [Saccharopolyspora antimicrobica]RKT88606.1 carbonic anhydrase [Saccharopolyspora antimicrobica]SFM82077.1 carbonic anhydrase [Saccharopolyspora antimicrobica]
MQHLADGIRRFQQGVFPAKAELFARLATEHRPRTLFIGCSDARVVPELITQQDPGELFVVRTAGNLVPAHSGGADGVAASIEYAIDALEVSDVVVCGHSSCGAMTALAERRDLSALPTTAGWLRHADASLARAAAAGGNHQVDVLVRHNVLAQLANLATHPCVARAVASGRIALHGWVFDIATGVVTEVGHDLTTPVTAA